MTNHKSGNPNRPHDHHKTHSDEKHGPHHSQDEMDEDGDEIELEHLIVEEQGPVVKITINRPQQLNALNDDVLFELESTLFDIIDPETTRVIVIQGAGTKAFVAGADIEAMSKMNAQEALTFARNGQGLTRALETLPQIVIAKVQGFALGGGMELAMACDLIIASNDARFGQPEVGLGLIPGFGGTQRLARRVGLPIALDLLTSGRQRLLSGEEAYQLGLISRVVPADKLDSELEKMISGILANGPEAVAEAKRLCRESYMMTLEAGLSAEASAFANCFSRSESKIGMGAFLEKKRPDFDKLV